MTKIVPGSARRLQARRACAVRSATVLWIGVAALASCQRFHDYTAPRRTQRHTEFAEHDACLDHGGSWVTEDRSCRSTADETNDAERR